jgi:hypothetical protein
MSTTATPQRWMTRQQTADSMHVSDDALRKLADEGI